MQNIAANKVTLFFFKPSLKDNDGKKFYSQIECGLLTLISKVNKLKLKLVTACMQ